MEKYQAQEKVYSGTLRLGEALDFATLAHCILCPFAIDIEVNGSERFCAY